MTDDYCIHPVGGFFYTLTVLFIGLKLIGHITWSWFWVLCPVFMPIVISFLVLGTLFILAVVFDI